VSRKEKAHTSNKHRREQIKPTEHKIEMFISDNNRSNRVSARRETDYQFKNTELNFNSTNYYIGYSNKKDSAQQCEHEAKYDISD